MGKGIFVIINIIWNRASKGNLTAMYDAGHIKFCNEMEQQALDVDELPAEVVLEMNARFCQAVDPNTHNGFTHKCRTCGAYMVPLKSVKYDLYIHTHMLSWIANKLSKNETEKVDSSLTPGVRKVFPLYRRCPFPYTLGMIWCCCRRQGGSVGWPSPGGMLVF